MAEFKGFHRKQIEFFRNCHHRYNIKDGATRSGKTYMDLYLLLYRIREVADKDGIIVILGNTRGTLQRNIIEPLVKLYGTECVGQIRSDNTCELFGAKVYMLGADKNTAVDRIRGSSISYCYCDELATYSPEVFDMLKSRLDQPYSKLDATLNPESPTHWLYTFLYEKKDVDLYHQIYELEDNPTLSPQFVENLKKEYAGTVYYDRYILGKWVRAEGIIYGSFKDKHVVQKENLPEKYKRLIVACDYGTYNATVFLLLGEDYSGKIYLIKEYYYSGRCGMQKTDTEYTEDLKIFLGEIKPDNIIIDPSAASFITQVNRAGLRTKKAINDVLNGIRKTSSYFSTDRLYICNECTNTIRELQSYSWDRKTDREQPVKENDHCMDALRYGMMYFDRPHGSIVL